MKNRLLWFLAFLWMVVLLTAETASAQFSTTTNMGMKKPNAGLQTGWDVYLNGNFDQLDAYLGGINTLTQNSTTPSVSGAMNWKTNNTSTTAITNFTSGFPGQTIKIICTDTHTSMVSGSSLALVTPFACTTANSITLVLNGSVWTEVSRTRLGLKTCDIAVGDASGSVVTDAQLGPQKRVCQVPQAGTVLQVTVSADAGTPSILVGRSRCTTFTTGVCTAETRVNLTSSALAAAASGFDGCSNVGGTAGIDGGTTCSSTLQNTSLSVGDYIELVSGTAGGTAKLVTIHVLYSVND